MAGETLTGHSAGVSTAGSTSISFAITTSAIPVDALALACIVCDNAGASGVSPISGVTDDRGNTWYKTGAAATRTAGSAANDGVTTEIWAARVRTQIEIGDHVIASFGSISVVSKILHVFHAATDTANRVASALGTAQTSTASGTAPSLTSGSLATGQMVLGLFGTEGIPTFTGDSDTSNGSWVVIDGENASAGTDLTSLALRFQSKIVTGAGTQTWNPTINAARDYAIVLLTIVETVNAQALSDTAAASNAVTRAVVFARAAANAAAATNAITRGLVVARSVSNSAGASNAVTRGALVAARSLSNAAGASNAVTRSTVKARSTSNAAAAPNSVSPAFMRVRAMSNTAAASNSVTRGAVVRARSISNGAAASDTLARTQYITARSLANSAAATNALTGSNFVSRVLDSGKSTAAMASSWATNSISPVANREILFFFTLYSFGQTPAVSSVVGNGITYDLIASQPGASGDVTFLYRGLSASPTPGAITVNVSGTTGLVHGRSWGIVEVDPVDQSGSNGSGAIVQSVKDTGTSTSPSKALAAFGSANNGVFVGIAWDASNGHVASLAAGFFQETNQVETTTVGAITGFVPGNLSPAAGTLTGSESWVIIAVEIKRGSTPQTRSTSNAAAAGNSVTSGPRTYARSLSNVAAAANAVARAVAFARALSNSAAAPNSVSSTTRFLFNSAAAPNSVALSGLITSRALSDSAAAPNSVVRSQYVTSRALNNAASAPDALVSNLRAPRAAANSASAHNTLGRGALLLLRALINSAAAPNALVAMFAPLIGDGTYLGDLILGDGLLGGPAPTHPIDAVIAALLAAQTRILRRVDIYESDGVNVWLEDVNVIDGGVDVSSSLPRRTCTFTLEGDDRALRSYPGGFWYDKILKTYRGVVLADGSEWWEQVGEFRISPISGSNFPANVVKISGKDTWVVFTRESFPTAVTFAKGQTIEGIVETIAGYAGVTKLRLAVTGKTLGKDWTVDTSTKLADAMVAIVAANGCEVFGDRFGYLVLREIRDPATAPVAFTFTAGPGGSIVHFESDASDDRVYNHVIARGESSDPNTPPVWAEAENNDPSSPTRIATPGMPGGLPRSTMTYSSPLLTTAEQCLDTATKLLKLAAIVDKDATVAATVVPMLDAGDIIRAANPNAAPGDSDRWLLDSFSIPWQLGPTTYHAKQALLVG